MYGMGEYFRSGCHITGSGLLEPESSWFIHRYPSPSGHKSGHLIHTKFILHSLESQLPDIIRGNEGRILSGDRGVYYIPSYTSVNPHIAFISLLTVCRTMVCFVQYNPLHIRMQYIKLPLRPNVLYYRM